MSWNIFFYSIVLWAVVRGYINADDFIYFSGDNISEAMERRKHDMIYSKLIDFIENYKV